MHVTTSTQHANIWRLVVSSVAGLVFLLPACGDTSDDSSGQESRTGGATESVTEGATESVTEGATESASDGATSDESATEGGGTSGTSSTSGTSGTSGTSNTDGESTGSTSGELACDPMTCPGACKDDVCTRITKCDPAPIGSPGEAGTLHDTDFIYSLVDLEFDPTCNAWGVTIISGIDYLRSMSPQGEMLAYSGVTNLDMGEVSVLQEYITPKAGNAEPMSLEVALSYVCCAACSCDFNTTSQGVAHFQPMTGELPMVIQSQTFTEGAGPFNAIFLDAGPSGLSYGTDQVLYVGNIDVNGDYYRIDLSGGEKTLLTTFDSRVYTSAPFDENHMLVALESGEVLNVNLEDASLETFTTSDVPVIGMIRDFFEGAVYISRNDGQIWKYDEEGTGALEWTAKDLPRISIAPDGYLYALQIPPQVADVTPTVQRWKLPSTK